MIDSRPCHVETESAASAARGRGQEFSLEFRKLGLQLTQVVRRRLCSIDGYKSACWADACSLEMSRRWTRLVLLGVSLMGERARVSASEPFTYIEEPCAAPRRHRQDAMQASDASGLPSCESRFFSRRGHQSRTRSAVVHAGDRRAVHALIFNLLDLVDDRTHVGRSSIESSCGLSCFAVKRDEWAVRSSAPSTAGFERARRLLRVFGRFAGTLRKSEVR